MITLTEAPVPLIAETLARQYSHGTILDVPQDVTVVPSVRSQEANSIQWPSTVGVETFETSILIVAAPVPEAVVP